MPRKKFDINEIKTLFKQLTLMNDIFMSYSLDNNIKCVQAMINHLLPKLNLTVKEVHAQKKIAGLGRSIVLDILAIDTEGRLYNLEVQRNPRGATPKRARLHGAFLDVYTAKKGGDFEQTPECYIIFITETDVLGYGLLVYTVRHTIEEANHAIFKAEQTFIYLNCSAENDGSPAWKLAHDMKCADPDKMLIPEIAETVRDNRENAPLKLMEGDGEMNEHTMICGLYNFQCCT